MALSSFTCGTCGQRHDGLPSLSFEAPHHYQQMPAEARGSAFLNADICAIADEDFFVRGTIEIPVHGQTEPFIWGAWVSLSRPNFERYVASLKEDSHDEGPFFGWLCNRLPGYHDTLHLKTNVFFRAGNVRPRIEVEPTEHRLAVHQRDGMSERELHDIVQANFHRQ
jgi:hypothetical protein